MDIIWLIQVTVVNGGFKFKKKYNLEIFYLIALQLIFGSTCSSTSQCQTNFTCNIISGSNTGSCGCDSQYYYNANVGVCAARISLNHQCTLNDYCVTNAVCILPTGGSAYYCSCGSGYYNLNGVCGKFFIF